MKTGLLAKLGFTRKKQRHTSALSPRRLGVELLEDRRMLAVFTVTNTNDGVVNNLGDLPGTLRQAIFDAEQFDDADTIVFASNLDGATITLTEGQLVITEEVTIDATALASGLTIDASGNDPTPTQNNGDGSRVFRILPSANNKEFALKGLAITGGDTLSSGSGIFFRRNFGGGTLSIEGSEIYDNSAPSIGGGIYFQLLATSGNPGALSIKDSAIYDNSAGSGGGGIFFQGDSSTNVTLSIEDSDISGNTTFGQGGGVATNGGIVNIARSTISDNVFAERGGGVSLSSVVSATITDTQFLNNEASFGGGLRISSSGNAIGSPPVEITIENSEFIGNKALSSIFGNGGGIHLRFQNGSTPTGTTLNFINNTVADNEATVDGGGIYADLYGDASNTLATVPILNIVNSIVTGNKAAENGGGVWVCTKYGAEFNMASSTVSGNTAGTVQMGPFGGGPTILGGNGGGLLLGVPPFLDNDGLTANLENITLSGNSALSQGGGLWVGVLEGVGTGGVGVVANLEHVTITNNESPDGGGLFSDPDDPDQRISTTLSHTIISGNVVSDTDNTPNNIAGVIESNSSYNLIGTGVAVNPTGAGNLFSDNPGLLPLADNGGPTQTHLPQQGSNAVDAGNPSIASPPVYDQRGTPFDRVVNNLIDIGAAEFGTVVLGADFDTDGDVDGFDFLAWQRGFGTTSGANKGDGDADNDEDVDSDDLTAWEGQFGQSTNATSADFDNDGDFDGFDFLAWQRGFGTSSGAGKDDGDADNDGDVDHDDLAAWEGQFGQNTNGTLQTIVAFNTQSNDVPSNDVPSSDVQSSDVDEPTDFASNPFFALMFERDNPNDSATIAIEEAWEFIGNRGINMQKTWIQRDLDGDLEIDIMDLDWIRGNTGTTGEARDISDRADGMKDLESAFAQFGSGLVIAN